MKRIPTLAIAAIFTLAAACSDSATGPEGPNPPDAALDADVAAVAVQGTAEDVAIMAAMTGFPEAPGASLVLPPDRPGWLSDCTFDGESWNCSRSRDNGLDVTRVITLRDASGAIMQHYDPDLTASVEIVADIEGDVSNDRWSATIDRHRDMIWTGLAGAETSRTVNGTGTAAVTQTRFTSGGESRSRDMTGNFTLTDVVVPFDGGPHWPTSGTATRNYTITRPDGTVVTRTVVIVFNGTASPDATVDGEPFTFDLTARRAFPRR